MAKKIDVNGLGHYHDKVSAMLASEYSSSKTYAVGDYCFHAGTLYECTTAITTAEAWTSGHWTAAKLAEDTSALKTQTRTVPGLDTVDTWSENHYYLNTKNDTVDLSLPTQTSSQVRYLYVSCTKGDTFTITCSGADGSRAWAFVSAPENGVCTVLERAAKNASPSNLVKKAPDDAAYLIVNDTTLHGTVIKGVLLNSILEDLQSNIDANNDVINGTDGLASLGEPYIIDGSGNWYGENNRHIGFSVKSGDVVNVTAGNNSTTIAFLKSRTVVPNNSADFSTSYGARITVSANTSSGDITVPADCNYFYVAIYVAGKSNIPKSIVINGVEQTYNIREKIDTLAAEEASLQSDVESVQSDVKAINKTYATKGQLGIWGVRNALSRLFLSADFTDIAFLSGIDMNVFYDGYSTTHTIDLAKYKNVSTNEYTVSTQEELETAIIGASSGDTIYINEGFYTKIELTKSINLIGIGKVVFGTLALPQFENTSTPGIYRTSSTIATEPDAVLDISHIEEGKVVRLLKRAASNMKIAGCWAYSSSRVYAKPIAGKLPSETDIVAITSETAVIKCTAPVENAVIYMENIIVVGGARNVLYCDIDSYNTQKLIAKDCKFLYSTTYNNVSLYGVDGFFQNCESAFSAKDGFNYHRNNSTEYPSGPNTGTIANGLEIDCIGHDCGYGETAASPSDNGSTMHNGGTIVRINGIYYGNTGGNVADTSNGTVSYNYGCYAFDSTAPSDTNSADFWADNSAQMYLFGCRSSGNSQYNLYAGTDAEITVQNTEYTTHSGTITES